MKLKIISNGTPRGTSVINTETGEKLNNVISIEFCMTADGGHTLLKLGKDVELEMTNDSEPLIANNKVVLLTAS